MPFYTINHITKFRYTQPVTESVTEIRKKPLTEPTQRCSAFDLITYPPAAVAEYVDWWGNTIHHFDVLAAHSRLEIVARAHVEVSERPLPHAGEFSTVDWQELRAARDSGDHWDYLHESQFIRFTAALKAFATSLNVTDQQDDPFTCLMRIQNAIYEQFAYMPNTTSVDSPIDHVLAERAGVCQDFSHLMVSVGRFIGIPTRYVSGYLFHRKNADQSAADATHAWVEAWLPRAGWIGFDPTNNLIVQERHIRVAIGRDYDDVPPTRGVFKGVADSDLEVAVQVLPASGPPPTAAEVPVTHSGWAVQAPQQQIQAQQQ